MPRIDPHQLLECLKILLNDNGGIRTEEDVSRVASLMGKFSKKLVSKCIYVLILKHTDNSILDTFLTVGGWKLIYSWLTDAYSNRNWPFTVELLNLIVISPMDIERLKDNDCPKLVKTISKDSTNFAAKSLATQAVENWLRIVKGGAVMITHQQHQQQQMELTRIITTSTHTNGPMLSSGIVNIAGISSSEQPGKIITKNGIKKNEIKVLSSPIVEIPPQSFYKTTMRTDKKAIIDNHKARCDQLKRTIIKSKNKLKLGANNGVCEMNSVVKKLSEKDLQTLAAIKMTQNVAKLGRIPKKTAVSSTVTSSTTTTASTSPKMVAPVNEENWDEDDDTNANSTLENDDKNISNSGEEAVKDDAEKKTIKVSNGTKRQTVKKVGPNASLVVTDKKNKKPVKVYSSKGRNTGLDEEIKRPKIMKKSTLTNGQSTKRTAVVNKNENVTKKLKDSIQGSVGVSLPLEQSIPQIVNDTITSQSQLIQQDQQLVTINLPIGYQSPQMHQSTSQIVPIVDITENNQLVSRQVLPEPQLTPSRLNQSQSSSTVPAVSSPSSELKRKHVLQESDLFMESLTASTTKEVKKKRKRTLPPQPNQNSNINTGTTVSSNLETVAMSIEAPKFYTENENVDESKISEEDEQSNDLNNSTDNTINNTTMESEGTIKPGVLRLFRKKGQQKKSVRWKADNELIHIKYFEMDENERTNVAKPCTDMKQADSQFERQTLNRKVSIDDNMEEKTPWRIPSLLTLDPPLVEPGSKSTERETQANRERIVLQALYFDKNSVPDSPYEPDFEYHPTNEPCVIPLEDIHGRGTVYGYRHLPWPEQKIQKPETPTEPINNNHMNIKVNNGGHIFHNNNNNNNNNMFYKNKRPNKKGPNNHKYYKYKKYS